MSTEATDTDADGARPDAEKRPTRRQRRKNVTASRRHGRRRRRCRRLRFRNTPERVSKFRRRRRQLVGAARAKPEPEFTEFPRQAEIRIGGNPERPGPGRRHRQHLVRDHDDRTRARGDR